MTLRDTQRHQSRPTQVACRRCGSLVARDSARDGLCRCCRLQETSPDLFGEVGTDGPPP